MSFNTKVKEVKGVPLSNFTQASHMKSNRILRTVPSSMSTCLHTHMPICPHVRLLIAFLEHASSHPVWPYRQWRQQMTGWEKVGLFDFANEWESSKWRLKKVSKAFSYAQGSVRTSGPRCCDHTNRIPLSVHAARPAVKTRTGHSLDLTSQMSFKAAFLFY